WITIYITGKTDFREVVREKLENSPLAIMPGNIGGTGGDGPFADMYWVDESVHLRTIKEAIGSKLVWRYRLRFYGSLESFIESQNPTSKTSDFTDEEKALIREMQASA